MSRMSTVCKIIKHYNNRSGIQISMQRKLKSRSLHVLYVFDLESIDKFKFRSIKNTPQHHKTTICQK